jgi:hypothetical protein
MRVSCIFIGLLLGLSLLATAEAQSFNLNINVQTPDPSSGFPGAANQPGFWNGVTGGETGPRTMLDLNQQSTSIQFTATGGLGSSGYNNFAGNTGDYAWLLNAFADISDAAQYHFSGLTPGQYRIFTYAVEPSTGVHDVSVTIPGSIQGTQHVTGPMPGNQFIQGVTHSVHDLNVTGTSFEIDITGPFAHTDANGFQVTKLPVPEPSELLIFGAAAAILLSRRRYRGFRLLSGSRG